MQQNEEPGALLRAQNKSIPPSAPSAPSAPLPIPAPEARVPHEDDDATLSDAQVELILAGVQSSQEDQAAVLQDVFDRIKNGHKALLTFCKEDEIPEGPEVYPVMADGAEIRLAPAFPRGTAHHFLVLVEPVEPVNYGAEYEDHE